MQRKEFPKLNLLVSCFLVYLKVDSSCMEGKLLANPSSFLDKFHHLCKYIFIDMIENKYSIVQIVFYMYDNSFVGFDMLHVCISITFPNIAYFSKILMVSPRILPEISVKASPQVHIIQEMEDLIFSLILPILSIFFLVILYCFLSYQGTCMNTGLFALMITWH